MEEGEGGASASFGEMDALKLCFFSSLFSCDYHTLCNVRVCGENSGLARECC